MIGGIFEQEGIQRRDRPDYGGASALHLREEILIGDAKALGGAIQVRLQRYSRSGQSRVQMGPGQVVRIRHRVGVASIHGRCRRRSDGWE